MRQIQIEDQEAKIAADKSAKFKGTIQVRLDSLSFRDHITGELNRKNVERLISVFRSEGCRHNYRYNHILAVIEQQLDRAIQSSGTSREALLSNTQEKWPELHFSTDFRLKCLRGRHRVQAERVFLLPKKYSGRWISILPVRRFDLNQGY